MGGGGTGGHKFRELNVQFTSLVMLMRIIDKFRKLSV